MPNSRSCEEGSSPDSHEGYGRAVAVEHDVHTASGCIDGVYRTCHCMFYGMVAIRFLTFAGACKCFLGTSVWTLLIRRRSILVDVVPLLFIDGYFSFGATEARKYRKALEYSLSPCSCLAARFLFGPEHWSDGFFTPLVYHSSVRGDIGGLIRMSWSNIYASEPLQAFQVSV